jgi:tRNA 5-methylaminomethyl-2-thiouridine biosynthesis bifunctional protein
MTNETATLEWRNNEPYSTIFDDVYFSSDNGLLETEYVFIAGNDLTQRWQGLEQNTFSIIETGFGTGLNFLCAAKHWLENAPSEAKLTFTSLEKFPLTGAELQQALMHWPALKPLSDVLLSNYETLLAQGTCMLFNQRIELNLRIGDAVSELGKINTKADAWFLDGFAPSKNPDMWQAPLFAQMARLSHPNTSFATFTSAGEVRRGLTAAGFEVLKKPGFGKKREMIHGSYLGFKS